MLFALSCGKTLNQKLTFTFTFVQCKRAFTHNIDNFTCIDDGLFVYLQISMSMRVDRLLDCLKISMTCSLVSCSCLFVSLTFDPAFGWPVGSTWPCWPWTCDGLMVCFHWPIRSPIPIPIKNGYNSNVQKCFHWTYSNSYAYSYSIPMGTVPILAPNRYR